MQTLTMKCKPIKKIMQRVQKIVYVLKKNMWKFQSLKTKYFQTQTAHQKIELAMLRRYISTQDSVDPTQGITIIHTNLNQNRSIPNTKRKIHANKIIKFHVQRQIGNDMYMLVR